MYMDSIFGIQYGIEFILVRIHASFSMNPLGAYSGRRIEIMVKEGVDIANYNWFSVYCVSAKENFSRLPIPRSISVPPVLSDIRRKLDGL